MFKREDVGLLMMDIDGCLIHGNGIHWGFVKEFQEYAVLAQSKLVPPVVFCTGRGSEYVHALAQVLRFMFKLPSIVENGAYLFWPDNRIVLPHPMMAGKEGLIGDVKMVLHDAVVAPGIADFVQGKEGCVSVKSRRITDMDELERIVVKAIPIAMRGQLFVAHSTTAVDITVDGADKGSALKFYQDITGIPISKMLAIGDSGNDLPLMKAAGFVACPSNATDQIKELVRSRGGIVANNAGPAGVWEVLQMFPPR